MNASKRQWHFVWLVALTAIIIGGCVSDPTKGYANKTIYPTNVRTVAVPIFQSKSYTRNIEFELTDALIKEIESHTPYKVTSENRADTIISGEIRSVELDQLSKSRRTGLSEEVVVSVTVDFQWKDLRTGKVLADRKGISGHGLFVPSNPSGEPLERGQIAAVQQLAREIVSQLQSEW